MINYLNEQIQRLEAQLIIYKNNLIKVEKVQFKNGDVLFCLSKKKAVLLKDIDINFRTLELEAHILSVEPNKSGEDIVTLEDLIPYHEAAHLLYGK